MSAAMPDGHIDTPNQNPIIKSTLENFPNDGEQRSLSKESIALISPLDTLLTNGITMQQIFTDVSSLLHVSEYKFMTHLGVVEGEIPEHVKLFSYTFEKGPSLAWMIPNNPGEKLKQPIRSSALAYPSAWSFLQIATHLESLRGKGHPTILISGMINPIILDGTDARHGITSVKAGVRAEEMIFVSDERSSPVIGRFLTVMEVMSARVGILKTRHVRHNEFTRFMLQDIRPLIR